MSKTKKELESDIKKLKGDLHIASDVNAKLETALDAANARIADLEKDLLSAQSPLDEDRPQPKRGTITVRLSMDVWRPDRIASGTPISMPFEEAMGYLEAGKATRA